MEPDAVVELVVGQLLEISDRARRIVVEQLRDDGAAGRLEYRLLRHDGEREVNAAAATRRDGKAITPRRAMHRPARYARRMPSAYTIAHSPGRTGCTDNRLPLR